MIDKGHRGLTLVEMLVVLGVIAVLAGFVVALTARVGNQSREKALDNAFALLNSALREYYEFKGEFPAQPVWDSGAAVLHVEEMLRRLRSVPACRRVLEQLSAAALTNELGAADTSELRDPWGTVMDYVHVPGDNFPELISAGRDKVFGTEDDISSKARRSGTVGQS